MGLQTDHKCTWTLAQSCQDSGLGDTGPGQNGFQKCESLFPDPGSQPSPAALEGPSQKSRLSLSHPDTFTSPQLSFLALLLFRFFLPAHPTQLLTSLRPGAGCPAHLPRPAPPSPPPRPCGAWSLPALGTVLRGRPASVEEGEPWGPAVDAAGWGLRSTPARGLPIVASAGCGPGSPLSLGRARTAPRKLPHSPAPASAGLVIFPGWGHCLCSDFFLLPPDLSFSLP